VLNLVAEIPSFYVEYSLHLGVYFSSRQSFYLVEKMQENLSLSAEIGILKALKF